MLNGVITSSFTAAIEHLLNNENNLYRIKYKQLTRNYVAIVLISREPRLIKSVSHKYPAGSRLIPVLFEKKYTINANTYQIGLFNYLIKFVLVK